MEFYWVRIFIFIASIFLLICDALKNQGRTGKEMLTVIERPLSFLEPVNR